MTNYKWDNYRREFDLRVCSGRAGKHLGSPAGIPDEYLDDRDRIHCRINGELVKANIGNLKEELERRIGCSICNR